MPGRARTLRRMALGLFSAVALAACTPGSVGTGGSVYYDSMLWNDYYYGNSRPGYRPPSGRPDLPERPDRPVRPPGGVDPGFSRPPRPPGGIDPGFSRPGAARPAIHRPSGGGPRGRR